MIAGIGGVNPEVATLGSVTFARYAVQVALQYEFDAREIPSNYSTGSEFMYPPNNVLVLLTLRVDIFHLVHSRRTSIL